MLRRIRGALLVGMTLLVATGLTGVIDAGAAATLPVVASFDAAAPAHLTLTGALTVSPAQPVASQPTTISFVVGNDGGAPVPVPLFLAGVRDHGNAHKDFPASPAVTLQAGQSYTYRQSRTLAVGDYTAWPAYYDGSSWHELGNRSSFTVSAGSCVPGAGGANWPPACWRPYTASSVFNQAVPANPVVSATSSQVVDYLLHHIAGVPHPNWLTVPRNGRSGEATYWSRPTDPLFTVHCTDFGGCPAGLEQATIRIPAGAQPEGGSDASTNPTTADRHITVVDQTSGWEYDLWRVQVTAPLPVTGGPLDVGFAGRTRIDGPGTADLGHGTASGFGDLAGRVRAEEVQSGTINHALFIVVNCDSGTAVPPARYSDQRCLSIGLDDTFAPPMGAWLQLDMSSAEIDAPSIPAWERPYLRAMASYGMYIGDTGSQGYFAIEAESGNQYTSMGAADRWLNWGNGNQGQSGWSFYSPDDTWVGHWTGVDWSRLRVLCRPEDTTCHR